MKTLLATIALLAVANLQPAFGDDAKGGPAGKGGDVEKRITELHTKLKITGDQEDLFKPVADEMRSRANDMKDLISKREKDESTMTALDDLKTYGDIAEAHAQGIKKFVDVFAPLYNKMDDSQKKIADDYFREHKEHKHKKGGAQASAKDAAHE